jgi:voltage-gated potassium channel
MRANLTGRSGFSRDAFSRQINLSVCPQLQPDLCKIFQQTPARSAMTGVVCVIIQREGMMKRKTRILKRKSRAFIRDVIVHTPVVRMTFLLVALWMLFSAGIFLGEQGAEGTTITSYGKALYWGIAAFSTAGIADMPVTGISELIGAIWIIVGSLLFFGAIVATVTAYFMRPMQRPSKQIVDTIEYNLEQLDDLSIEELELLKETTDSLIEHVEHLKTARSKST